MPSQQANYQHHRVLPQTVPPGASWIRLHYEVPWLLRALWCLPCALPCQFISVVISSDSNVSRYPHDLNPSTLSKLSHQHLAYSTTRGMRTASKQVERLTVDDNHERGRRYVNWVGSGSALIQNLFQSSHHQRSGLRKDDGILTSESHGLYLSYILQRGFFWWRLCG